MGLIYKIDRIKYESRNTKIEDILQKIEKTQENIYFSVFNQINEGIDQIDDNQVTSEISTIINILSTYPTKFSFFEIEFQLNYRLTNESSRQLAQRLASNQNLTSISISNCYLGNINNSMNYTNLLEQIVCTSLVDSLQNIKLYIQSSILINKVSSFIQSLKNLKAISLTFGRYYHLNDEGAAILGQSLALCSNLQYCCLSLYKCNFVSNIGEISIAQGLAYCKKLRLYYFNTGDHDDCEGLDSIQILKHLKLTNLSLHVLEASQGAGAIHRKMLRRKAIRKFKHLVTYIL